MNLNKNKILLAKINAFFQLSEVLKSNTDFVRHDFKDTHWANYTKNRNEVAIATLN